MLCRQQLSFILQERRIFSPYSQIFYRTRARLLQLTQSLQQGLFRTGVCHLLQ